MYYMYKICYTIEIECVDNTIRVVVLEYTHYERELTIYIIHAENSTIIIYFH